MLLSLALGFSEMSSSGYRLATSELPSFSLLNAGPRPVALAAVPLLLVSAPFLITRNTILGRPRMAAASSSCF